MPRGQGSAALLRRRGHAVQPAPQAEVPRPGRHPDHAHRRGRDRRRRRARPPDEEGRSRRHRADVRPRERVPTDSLEFLEAVPGLPEQLAAAHEAAAELHAERFPAVEDVRNIVVLGMGGSGISGDVIAAVFNDELPVPVTVLKQYRVPAFVGPGTLAFAVSYSGDTEETVSMATAAVEVRSDARRDLARWRAGAARRRAPRPARPVPRRLSPTRRDRRARRTARRGAVPHRARARRARVARARPGTARTPARRVPPRRSKASRTPRASSPVRSAGRSRSSTAAARWAPSRAYRWKCDINENAKAPAYWHAYPELDHNEICAWGQHGDVTRQLLSRRRVATRLRARTARAPIRHHARDHRGSCAPGVCASRRRAKVASRSSSTSCTSATGSRAISRSTTTSIPARSTRSSS